MVNDTPSSRLRAFAASALVTAALLLRGHLRLADGNVDRRLVFADGTSSRVYRETVRAGAPTREPALLVVEFRLRLVGRNARLHRLFRAESIANTPLFAGFPGFRWKLWCTDEQRWTYRGVYEWDGADRAVDYATTLSSLLRLVCVPSSVRFHVEPGFWLADVLQDPSLLAADEPPPDGPWWRLRHEAAA